LKFDALFTPETRASIPGPPVVTDPAPPSQGKGEFITQQSFAMAGST
jgi:hypothetical protein